MDATVLRASDADALNRWLSDNGYPAGPRLRPYLRRYVEHGWFVTAFKIDPGSHAGHDFGTRAVTMAFDTDAPFYPYAEPPSANDPRPFRVSVLSTSRVAGHVGLHAERSRPWGARVGFARPLTRRQIYGVIGGTGVPLDAVRDGMWLTVLDEPRSRRGREDVVFRPAGTRERVAPSLRTRIRIRGRGR
jgi:hypothetical protein